MIMKPLLAYFVLTSIPEGSSGERQLPKGTAMLLVLTDISPKRLRGQFVLGMFGLLLSTGNILQNLGRGFFFERLL